MKHCNLKALKPCVEGITYLNLNPKSLNNDVYLEDQGT